MEFERSSATKGSMLALDLPLFVLATKALRGWIKSAAIAYFKLMISIF